MPTTITGTDGVSQVQADVIVGTVSESGGVPTGAIIERGSNANGEFVKYADGTLICFGSAQKDLTILNTFFGGRRSGGGAFQFSWPSAFITNPIVTVVPDNVTCFSALDRQSSSTTADFYVTAVESQSSSTRVVEFHAIGRWY